jgi:hypothetical protein
MAKLRPCGRYGCVYCPRKRNKECKCSCQKANVDKCDCGIKANQVALFHQKGKSWQRKL